MDEKKRVPLNEKDSDGCYTPVTQRQKEAIDLWKEVPLCLISCKPLSVFSSEAN